MSGWDAWVEAALDRLAARRLLRSTLPIRLPAAPAAALEHETFDAPGPWDRDAVEVEVEEPHLIDLLSQGQELHDVEKLNKKFLLFSGNDYMGLSTHPAVRTAAAKAAQEYGMGPRGSALICGYTTCHKLLEASLAELKKKENCVLCPTGFAANVAFVTALGSISSLLTPGSKPSENIKIAVFSDSLNHASIIDGIRLAERQQEVKVFVYKHCDMAHLQSLLSNCTMEKKVVITDSLFSMDGDFAPLPELAALRRKYRFLLAIDDAHGTFVCGDNGGGAAELFGCEDEVDICIGTLSKAAGCQGGFIACSNKWKQLIQSRGRSFIFSTALPVPIVAASHAALIVAREEKWRRASLWQRIADFSSLTGLPVSSPIISVVIGSEEAALRAGRYMLRLGFHITPIRPPTVPANSCRLRITLSAAHSFEDVHRLAAALVPLLDKATEVTPQAASKL